jgi:hypothetical protein
VVVVRRQKEEREGGRDARRSGLECRFHGGLEASALFLLVSSVFFFFLGANFRTQKKKHGANWTIAFLGEKNKKKLQKSPYFEEKKVTCRHI